MLYDAHCHLQDKRLAHVTWDPHEHVSVVNGTQESDWENVAALAKDFPDTVVPCFGLHPWFVKERSSDWLSTLEGYLDEFPEAHIGEAGLDRWIEDYDLPDQETVFRAQLELAAERNRAISIHCLQAWGRMLEMLQEGPRPERGFLLHSYGGSREMVDRFAELGAYFSFPGYYLHERKHKQRDAFRAVPLERLLVETDCPDQLLPEDLDQYQAKDENGERINHPQNLEAVYEGLAKVREISMEQLTLEVKMNWKRLFMS